MAIESGDEVRELISQDSALTQRREPWIALWKTIADFVQPYRQFYAPDDSTRSKELKTLYNSRGVLAHGTAFAMFQAYTANEYSEWFKLIFTDTSLIRYPGVADWLEDVENVLKQVFLRCGLYQALAEYSSDLHGIGTATLYMEHGKKPGEMVYQCRHPRALTIAEGADGKVDTVFEDAFMTARNAVERFGEDKVPERVKRANEKHPYQDIVIKHSVMPMDEKFRRYAKRDFDPRMPWVSIWWDKDTSSILDVAAYWDFPYAVGRRAKNSGEDYGRSEAMNALGDIKGANQITKSTIQLAQLISDPAFVAHEDLKGRDDVIPHGRIYVANNEQPFNPVALGANYPITTDREERVDRIINEHFFIPFYAAMASIESGPVRSATEIIEKTGEKAAVLGYLTGRHHTECLHPIIRNTVNALMRDGQLPAPPKIVQDAYKANIGLDISFRGRLSQLQAKYFQSDAITATASLMAGAVQLFGTEALDNVDSDEYVREGLESVGAPQKVIREMPDVEERRRQRAEAMAAQQQQAMQFQNQQTLMQNAKGLGEKPQPGSPLEQMTAAAGGAR
jgi:hypothetical protein